MDSEKHLIVTHKRPQASDLLYIYLVKHFATEATHRGISNGIEVSFLDNDKDLKDEKGQSLVPFIEAMDEAEVSFCGRGGGMYDEHGKDILDCEATLLGKKLGLLWEVKPGEKVWPNQSFEISDRNGTRKKKFAVRDPKLRDLFAVVARDDTSGSPPYSLGNMIDLMHYRYPDDPEKVMKWTFRLFDAVCKYGPIPKEERKERCQDNIRALLGALDDVGKYPDASREFHPNARERLREWLNKRLDNDFWQPLDLIDASAQVLPGGWQDPFDWPYEVVAAEVERQHHFHTVSAEEAKKAELIDVQILIKDGESERTSNRKIAVVESDDLDVHKYLSAVDLGYYAICVIKKNSRGQVQIFPGNFSKEVRRGGRVKVQQLSYNFPMGFVAAALRVQECGVRGLPVPSWPELVSDRGPASEQTWFYYSRTGWLMNGSLTMPDVSPTAIPLSEIAETVRRGFSVEYAGARQALVATWNSP